jgi:hypothetical protein
MIAPSIGSCGAGPTLLLLFHYYAAAFQLAGAGFGDDYLGGAFGADVNFA